MPSYATLQRVWVEFVVKLPDLRVGDVNAPDPLATYSWPELRELIYGDSGLLRLMEDAP